MAVTIAQHNANTNGGVWQTGGSLVATLPSAPAAGNLLLLFARCNAGTAITPAGWTSIYLNGGRTICWKSSAGTETSVVWTTSAATEGVGWMAEFAGWSGVAPTAGTVVFGANTTQAPTVTVPSTTGGLLLTMANLSNSAAPQPTMTETPPGGSSTAQLETANANDIGHAWFGTMYAWQVTSEPSGLTYVDSITGSPASLSTISVCIWIPPSAVVAGPPRPIRVASQAVKRASFF